MVCVRVVLPPVAAFFVLPSLTFQPLPLFVFAGQACLFLSALLFARVPVAILSGGVGPAQATILFCVVVPICGVCHVFFLLNF